MRITEAVAKLQDECAKFQFSKTKIKTCLKVEMKKIEDTLKELGVEQSPEYVVEEALKAARRTIASGSLFADVAKDSVGTEVANREGRGRHWKLEHMHGVSAPRMRIGRQDS